jgi:hypothetical protein
MSAFLLRSTRSIATAAPTVTLVSPTIGKLAGGRQATLTGTDFTGATSVTFGGVAATSVTVVDATTITCTPPANTAGVKDVAVTTSGGTGTGTGLYEYFDLAAECSGRCLYLGGDYAGSTWTATVGTDATQTSSPAPTAVDGCPDFEVTTDFPLGAAVLASTWAGVADKTYFAVINLESVLRDSGSIYSNDGLIGDSAAYCGLYLRDNSGTIYAYVYEWDSGVKSATADITSLLTGDTGWITVLGRKISGQLDVRVANMTTDTGWISGSSGVGNLNASAANLRIGNPTPDGVMKAVGVASTGWNATTSDKVIAYMRAEYP